MRHFAWVFAITTVGTGATRADDLPRNLKSFLLSETPAEREAARARVLVTPALDYRTLADAFDHVDLWPARERIDNPLRFELGRNLPLTLEVALALPRDYSPAKKWPLLIALHGQGQSAESILHVARGYLGARAAEFILAAPRGLDGPGFSEPPDREMRPRHLLIALRKRLHLDNDRVFIMGYSLGGHRTWLTVALHHDCFAGAMPLAGVLQLPGMDMLYRDVLPNVRNVFVLCAWGMNDFGVENGQPKPGTGIAHYNAIMADMAHELKLERLSGFPLVGVGHVGVTPPAKELAELFGRKRDCWPHDVHHAIRIAQTGSAAWIRIESLIGETLPELGAGEIKFKLAPGQDADAALAKYLHTHIARVDARVSGQSVVLETQKCGSVRVLLHDELVDLSRPITVLRNRRKVFDGLVTPDLGLTLDEAVREWEFQSLPRAALIVATNGRAKVYRSTAGAEMSK